MKNELDENQKIYHDKHYQKLLDDNRIDGYINPNSIWYWMHTYCLEEMRDFFQRIPHSYFLTVGDGYCGREANYIKNNFGHKVHSSDVSICLLEKGKELGLIDEYSEQDVSNLSFEDNTFDYCLSKECLHHISKPYQGIYEMMRVSKKGIIIIEPNGDLDFKYKISHFEESGNYCFRFNSGELMKVGLSMGYKYFVLTYSNMFFGYHNIDNIVNGREEEEKRRLIEMNNKMEEKPLLIFLMLKNQEDYNLFNNDKFKKINI